MLVMMFLITPRPVREFNGPDEGPIGSMAR